MMTALDSQESNAFRNEVRQFCTAELPEDIRSRVEVNAPLEKSDYVRWQKLLHKRGWIAGHWPKQYGGLDWTPLQRYIFMEETLAAGAPRIAPYGLAYVGPVLYTYGTDRQKERFLPGILSSDTWWCQGYSEPGAGSDLASLSTRAVLEAGHYRVTGQKIWTTTAHYADMIFCLVRTGSETRRQDGISFLLIDMKSPGVTVRPIVTMDLCHELNEVFFDDVRVPAENLVGEEGKGWVYAKFLLGNERLAAVSYVGQARRMMRSLRALAERVTEAGLALWSDVEFQREYAALDIRLSVLNAMCVRQLTAILEGRASENAGSILKLRGTELLQAIGQKYADVLGHLGFPYEIGALRHLEGSPGADEQNTGLLRQHLIGRAISIFGGTAEVQRNIIAKASLGL
jgi:alkylation response protein AidB-like acyl-CoA dehydrogenase